MTDINHQQIRDLLPDVVNDTVGGEQRRQIEDHLRSCSECASEMRVLQMVRDAPSFAPMIDAVTVSSKILPYGGVPVERPRSKFRAWQMVAAVAAVLLVALTLVPRASQPVRAPGVAAPQVAVSPTKPTNQIGTITRTDSPARKAVVRAPAIRELQVAAGLEDLSDGNLARLANDLGALDGLPSEEPENLGVADAIRASGGGQ